MKVGSKTVKMGIAKTRFSLRFLKNWNKSRVFHMANAAITNNVNSRAMFTEPSMAIKVKPNSLVDKATATVAARRLRSRQLENAKLKLRSRALPSDGRAGRTG